MVNLNKIQLSLASSFALEFNLKFPSIQMSLFSLSRAAAQRTRAKNRGSENQRKSGATKTGFFAYSHKITVFNRAAHFREILRLMLWLKDPKNFKN